MYYTYIIQSTTSGTFYIGQTNDLEDRILRHNSDRNKWTKKKGPWVLVYSEAFPTRAEAVVLESHLKSFKNPLYLAKWLEARGG